VTQAAARTFALRLAELGDEFERGFHNLLQLHHEHGARTSRPIARAPTNQFNVCQSAALAACLAGPAMRGPALNRRCVNQYTANSRTPRR
jgi:hypothetical protein